MPHFTFDPNEHLANLGGAAIKYRHNVTALALLKQLEHEKRTATLDEQHVLSRYSGWGDSAVLNQACDTNNLANPELADLVTPNEFTALRASSLNAHYTALGIIRAMWQGLLKLGTCSLPALKVLEPSAGIGHFLSCMPASAAAKSDCMAVELDPLTARILRHLHPHARVLAQGFETLNLPPDTFDLVISNVPFGDYAVHDPNFSPRFIKSCIHDYFCAKSVQVARPGGIIALISSRYTLDKKDKRLRQWLAERADLLAAVRLPCNAFKANAGTEVVTDVIFLRKKINAKDASITDLDWADSEPVHLYSSRIAPTQVFVNRLFQCQPDWILGTQTADGKLYRSDGYSVTPNGNSATPADLERVLTRTLLHILPADVFVPRPNAQKVPPAPITVNVTNTTPESEFDQALARHISDLPNAHKGRIMGLRTVFIAAKTVIAAQLKGYTVVQVEQTQAALNHAYDDFVLYYGYINDPRNEIALKNHPALPFLRALEVISTGTLPRKAALFSQFALRAAVAMRRPHNPREALLLCLDRFGSVDVSWMATQLGVTDDVVITELNGQIFHEPVGKQWLTADDYLSGNVRVKLREAQAAAIFDPKYHANATALQAVQPDPLRADEITARLGAGWIPTEVVKSFIETLMPGLSVEVTYLEPLGKWTVDLLSGGWLLHEGIEATQTWGTQRRHALNLIDDALNVSLPIIYDDLGGTPPQRAVNQNETLAAQAKQAEIKARFAEWVWIDDARCAQLVARYNDRFNCWQVRRYDGAHLSLAGLATDFVPRPHQLDAVWRILQCKTTLLGHVVGAGKTATLLMAAYELKRLGMARKTLIAVPNHLTEQWLNEALRLYPSLRILCASKHDFSPAKRSEFLSRIATDDWDLIIIAHSQLKLLPLSHATVRMFVQAELDTLRDYLEDLRDEQNGRKARKEIEKAIKRHEVRLDELNSMRKDSATTITFEELGIQALMVDEFHAYKNLYFATKMTRIAGLPNAHSERAFDMLLKVRWLLGRGHRVVAATGTPISNTLAEAYTLMRYLQPELLEAQGLSHFDAWAQSFGDTVAALEMSPDGGSFRMNMSFAKFVNLPELAMLSRQCLDVRTAEQLNLPRPTLYSGQPLIVTLPISEALRAYVKSLGERVEHIRSGQVDPQDDNMLKITGDGRKAALDLRLVDASAKEDPSGKINMLVQHVAAIWQAATPSRGTQLVFCDLGTPKGRDTAPDLAYVADTDDGIIDAINDSDSAGERVLTNQVYHEIKRKLLRAGIPECEIAFIHDCKQAKTRQALFAKVNSGEVRVLLGSTEKMGTGMNVQQRLIALHHLDATWRCDGIEQREGRILRQGNGYDQVFVFTYVVEGSFDGVIWQTLERKARFVAQFMAGTVTARSAGDVSEAVLSYAQVKSLASGNPLVMQRVLVESELIKLSRLKAVWQSGRHSLQNQRATLPMQLQAAHEAITKHTSAIDLRNRHPNDPFCIELNAAGDLWSTGRMGEPEPLDSRERAGQRLMLLAEQLYRRVKNNGPTMYSFLNEVVGQYRGFEIGLKVFANESAEREVWLKDLASGAVYVGTISNSATGTLASIDYALRHIEAKLKESQDWLTRLEQQRTAMDAELAKPWEYSDRLSALRRDLASLTLALQHAGVVTDEDTVTELDISEHAEAGVASTPPSAPMMLANVESQLAEVIRAISGMHTGMDLLTAPVEVVEAMQPLPRQARVAPSEIALQQMEQHIDAQLTRLVFGQSMLPRLSKPVRKPASEQLGLLAESIQLGLL